jgi:NADH:ubiquinone oxidoreductase subunit H
MRQNDDDDDDDDDGADWFCYESGGHSYLLERSLLGYVHIRKGPNKTDFMGIFQFFSDGIKLSSSEQYSPLVFNYLSYYSSPFFGLFLSLFVRLLIT